MFGTNQVQDLLVPLVKAHTDEKGRWVKDPNKTRKESFIAAAEEQIETVQQKSINQVI